MKTHMPHMITRKVCAIFLPRSLRISKVFRSYRNKTAAFPKRFCSTISCIQDGTPIQYDVIDVVTFSENCVTPMKTQAALGACSLCRSEFDVLPRTIAAVSDIDHHPAHGRARERCSECD